MLYCPGWKLAGETRFPVLGCAKVNKEISKFANIFVECCLDILWKQEWREFNDQVDCWTKNLWDVFKPCPSTVLSFFSLIFASILFSHGMCGFICFIYQCPYLWLWRCGWWGRHDLETFSTLLVLYEGNPPLIGGFPHKGSVTVSIEVFFNVCPGKRLNKPNQPQYHKIK